MIPAGIVQVSGAGPGGRAGRAEARPGGPGHDLSRPSGPEEGPIVQFLVRHDEIKEIYLHVANDWFTTL